MTIAQLTAYVELLEAAGGIRGYEALTAKPRRLSFRDAICFGIVRLYRIRTYAVLAHIAGHATKSGKPDICKVRREIVAAVETAVYLGKKTTLRAPDRDWSEANRTPALTGEFGPGGAQGPITRMTDGLKWSVEASGDGPNHRACFPQYFGRPCAQTQIVISQAFRVCCPLFPAGGSFGESTHIKDDLQTIIEGCEEGDAVGTVNCEFPSCQNYHMIAICKTSKTNVP